MILDRSTWGRGGDQGVAARRIGTAVVDRIAARAKAGDGAGSRPSFRGPRASGIAEKQGLPDTPGM